MNGLTTLARIFNQELLEFEDPNRPEIAPLLKKSAALRNQAFVRWYEEVGHYLIGSLEKALLGNIVKAIGHDRSTQDSRTANLRLLDKIQRDIEFVDHITKAYDEEEKRKQAPQKGIPK